MPTLESSGLLQDTSSSTGLQSQMRARSESQCEFDPHKRNIRQMLEKRGLPTNHIKPFHHKRREAKNGR